MIRILLSAALLGFIILANTNPLGSFPYWLWMFAVLVLAGLAFGGLFSFFLVTGLLALAYTDLQNGGGFSSVFLPFYTGFALMGLLAILVLMYPKLLGQKVKSSRRAGFWIGGL